MNVEVKSLPATRVAYLRHIGPYGTPGIPHTWQRLGAWCAEHGLTLPRRTMYGIAYDNPDVTPAEKCRYDACVEVDASFGPQGEIGIQTIAGGRYLCSQFSGTSATIHEGWTKLCRGALPDRGYQADDRPTLEIYPPAFAMDKRTGALSCLLCMPVRPL